MSYEIVTAQFSSCEQVNHALSGLHRAGIIGHTGDLPWAGTGGRATLHLSVPPGRTEQAQILLRHFGGNPRSRRP